MCPVVTTQAAVTTAAATKTFLATRTTTAATEAEREAARGAGETSTEILVPTPMTGKNGGHFLSKVLCYFSHLFGGLYLGPPGREMSTADCDSFPPCHLSLLQRHM